MDCIHSEGVRQDWTVDRVFEKWHRARGILHADEAVDQIVEGTMAFVLKVLDAISTQGVGIPAVMRGR